MQEVPLVPVLTGWPGHFMLRTDVAKDGLDWHFTLCRLWQTWFTPRIWLGHQKCQWLKWNFNVQTSLCHLHCRIPRIDSLANRVFAWAGATSKDAEYQQCAPGHLVPQAHFNCKFDLGRAHVTVISYHCKILQNYSQQTSRFALRLQLFTFQFPSPCSGHTMLKLNTWT